LIHQDRQQHQMNPDPSYIFAWYPHPVSNLRANWWLCILRYFIWFRK
jgi:hypothetical protein